MKTKYLTILFASLLAVQFSPFVDASSVTEQENMQHNSPLERRDGDDFRKCGEDRHCKNGRICSEIGWCRLPKDIPSRPKCNFDIGCPEGKLCAATGYCNLPERIPKNEVVNEPNKCKYDRECKKDRVCRKDSTCGSLADNPGTRCIPKILGCPDNMYCSENGWCNTNREEDKRVYEHSPPAAGGL